MAATTKLIVYNAALREIASAPLADTTTNNTRLFELNGAWDHAIEYVMGLRDWGFARRRSSLSSVADTSFPPYTRRMTKPADYLRKCWLRTSAADDHQVDHAEVAAAIYTIETTALLEYVSDHADNYDPANWPPHFTRVLTLHLASLVAPKLARAGADDLGRLNGQMQTALAEADGAENVFLTNTQIASERHPVMRRAIEFLGQQLAGSVSIHSHTDHLRWHMNRSWDHAVKYILEVVPWQFARRRATLSPSGAGSGGFTHAYTLPADYVQKLWVRASASDPFEAYHDIIGTTLRANDAALVLEYSTNSVSSPTSWTATFTECVAAYLALMVVPEIRLAETSKGETTVAANDLRDKIEAAFFARLEDAKTREANFETQVSITANRLPVMRRAMEFLGQSMAGSLSLNAHVNTLRWSMNATWDHTVKYVLELGAWNFATARSKLSGGIEADTIVPGDGGGLVEGYSLAPAAADTDTTPLTEFEYGFAVPSDYLHKIWIKSDPNSAYEVPHQFMGSTVFASDDPVIMEYIAYNSTTTDPANWSANFTDAVAAHLALSVAPEFMIEAGGRGLKVSANAVRDKLQKLWDMKLYDAKMRDAIQQYPKQIPPGRFVSARSGGTRSLTRSN